MPDKLPAKADPVWETALTAPGLGGVAATSEFVLVSDRELNDTVDVFRCLKAADGKEAWAHRVPAVGRLDYGNSPRATPLIHNDLVYCQGAFGDLACLELRTGKAKWSLNVRDEFDATDERKWGVCDSPLIADGNLIVAPGGKDAALAALDPKTGKPVWKVTGALAGYGSFVAAKLGGVLQIVGHDAETLGGWDAKSGKRLWTVKPDRRGDFNVPTPLVVGDKLLVTTENNGTRLLGFKGDGNIDPKPVAVNKKLAPDTHTPVVAGGHVFGVWNRLYCLSLTNGLREVYDEDGAAFSGYCAAVATDTRVLVVSRSGELILLDAAAREYTELGRLSAFGGTDKGVYAHPAFVGTRMYLRGSGAVIGLELTP
ncbi:PQQ-like beta-propeller repeat protein [Gemmata sp. JC717]|uniref:PQQ-like beta-propeller repeat protein n=1 Tax=Gemmata algarum TaxID=2975278 RepID=UPI0021BAC195|nr:PQQ-like beta-propeller repeat protein [Gemmata algarum]MDY3556405.1 PQQ-like beta-propeller repeat protein [Gemmata algarum]